MAGNGKGPWGSRGGAGGGSSGGSGSSGGRGGAGGSNDGGSGRGGGQPDIDDVIRQAQQQFNRFVPGGPGFKLNWPVLIGVLALLWAATGFYRVQPEEHVAILTFGQLTDTRTEAGLGYHIPWPVQQVLKVNVTFERRIQVGFVENGRRGSDGSAVDVPGESLMLTGDENIIDIDFVVLWRIGDAGKYLFEIRDPENTIKKVAESAMREVIGRTKIQSALTEGRGRIEADTKALMQSMLDEYHSGIIINDVQLQKVDPPSQVIAAFNDVQRARADKERMRNEATAYRNDILPKARGQAERLLQESEAYKAEVVNRAKGDADRFNSVYAAYAEAKDVTARRLYLETMQEVLSNSQKIIIDKDGGSGVVPYLPLNELQKKTQPPAAPQQRDGLR